MSASSGDIGSSDTTRQVGQRHLAERGVGPAPGADLDAGPRVVADRASCTGEGVEQRGLPGVRAAHEGDAACPGPPAARGPRGSWRRCQPCAGTSASTSMLARICGRRRSGRRRWPGSPRRRSSATGSAALAPGRMPELREPTGDRAVGAAFRAAPPTEETVTTCPVRAASSIMRTGYLEGKVCLTGRWSRVRRAEVLRSRRRRGSLSRPRHGHVGGLQEVGGGEPDLGHHRDREQPLGRRHWLRS